MVGRSWRAMQFMTMLFKGGFGIASSCFCQNDNLHVSTTWIIGTSCMYIQVFTDCAVLLLGEANNFNLKITHTFVKVLLNFLFKCNATENMGGRR